MNLLDYITSIKINLKKNLSETWKNSRKTEKNSRIQAKNSKGGSLRLLNITPKTLKKRAWAIISFQQGPIFLSQTGECKTIWEKGLSKSWWIPQFSHIMQQRTSTLLREREVLKRPEKEGWKFFVHPSLINWVIGIVSSLQIKSCQTLLNSMTSLEVSIWIFKKREMIKLL